MSAYQEIDSHALQQLMNKSELLLVDVRNDDEVARGVIRGATHIPMHQLLERAAELDGAQPLVFYCHSGIRSAQAGRYFAGQGRTHVYNLRGGVLGWGAAGNALVAKG